MKLAWQETVMAGFIPWAFPGLFGSILATGSLEINIDLHQVLIQHVLSCISQVWFNPPTHETHMTWTFPSRFGSILVISTLEISIDQHQALIQCALLCTKEEILVYEA